MMGRFKINVNVAMLWLSACILIFPFSSQAFIPSMKNIMQARTSLWGGGPFGFEKDENSVGEPPSESQETDSLPSHHLHELSKYLYHTSKGVDCDLHLVYI